MAGRQLPARVNDVRCRNFPTKGTHFTCLTQLPFLEEESRDGGVFNPCGVGCLPDLYDAMFGLERREEAMPSKPPESSALPQLPKAL